MLKPELSRHNKLRKMKKLRFLVVIFLITTSVSAQLKVSTTGNVGIGMINPVYKLDLKGNVRFALYGYGWDEIYLDGQNQWGTPQLYCKTLNFMVGNSNYPVNAMYVNWFYYKYLNLIGSDKDLKENVMPLKNTLHKLLEIESKRYTFKKDPEYNGIPEFEEMLTKETFGFIAQDIERVFPELVYPPNATNNHYSINYIGMIPVLLEAIKEQQIMIENLQKEFPKGGAPVEKAIVNNELQQEIESLKQEVAYIRELLSVCCNTNPEKSTEKEKSNVIQEFILSEPTHPNHEELKVYQNAPNPFNETTTIQCYIPYSIQKAELCVYNMQGIQVKCITVSERGKVTVQIQANQLTAGIYTYLLIGDGKASDAKQMILTK